MNSSMNQVATVGLASLSMLALPSATVADVVEFESRDEWVEAVDGNFTTIDFTGFAAFTLITDQFEDLGIIFEPGQNVIGLSDVLFPNDGAGLFGNGDAPIAFSFVTPQLWIAVDYPGTLVFDLYRDSQLVYVSSLFVAGGSGIGGFAGLLSDQPFDQVVIRDPLIDVFIDDLHFGVLESGPDVNGDGTVDVQDLIAVLLAWGTADRAADVTNDGIVDVADLIEVISNWS